jgi:hypothetical protein
MSAHEDDASRICVYCGHSFDVHEMLSPTCREGVGLGIDQRKEAMSETPQEIVTRWLSGDHEGIAMYGASREIREAIRAVLEENEGYLSYEPCPKCGCGVTASCYGCRLKAAVAERDTLRIDLQTADDQLRALRTEVER